MLIGRKKSSEKEKASRKLTREMEYEEALDSLPPDVDRLEWWRHHKDHLPLLARVAQKILGIPCNLL